MKILTAYFSRAGENYVSGQLRKLDRGNTEKAAEIIQDETGSDLFRIEMQQPYADDYNTCIAQAQKDQRNNARPALTRTVENLDQYDEIYLGFPNYWGTMPMAVFTFLESGDFSGKTIHPFITHEGSGFAGSLRDLQKECPGAKIAEGLAIHGTKIDQSEKTIREWVRRTK
jgi:flavodoxin